MILLSGEHGRDARFQRQRQRSREPAGVLSLFSVVVGCRRLSSVVVGCCRLLSLLSVVVGCLCLLVSRRSRPSRWSMTTSLPSWSQMEDGESSEQASTRGRNCAGHRKRRRTSAPGAWSSGSPRLGGAAVLFQCVCVCVAPSSAERLVMRCVAVGAGCRAGRPMSRCRCYFEARCRHRARACAMSFGLPC